MSWMECQLSSHFCTLSKSAHSIYGSHGASICTQYAQVVTMYVYSQHATGGMHRSRQHDILFHLSLAFVKIWPGSVTRLLSGTPQQTGCSDCQSPTPHSGYRATSLLPATQSDRSAPPPSVCEEPWQRTAYLGHGPPHHTSGGGRA